MDKGSTMVLSKHIASTEKVSRQQLIDLFLHGDLQTIGGIAEEKKNSVFGNKVILRGIVEFSNYCRRCCQYCGLNINNNKLQRFRMSHEEIINSVKEAYMAGYRAIVLQSGEDPFYTGDDISKIIKEIMAKYPVTLTLSIGERDAHEYKQWQKDGASRYLLKHETADPKLYKRLHPDSTLEERIGHLELLKSIGFETGSGFMLGLPGQDPSSVADDILLIKALDLDMAGIGIFISHPDTALAKSPEGSHLDSIKALALTRLLMKNIHLPSTTSVETSKASGSGTYKPLSFGANVIMKKVEPYKYRKLYEIYPNPNIKDISIQQDRDSLTQYLNSQGYRVY